MSEDFDVIVLGMGPGERSPRPGCSPPGGRSPSWSVRLIGGECAYWGCIPSKTLLRPPDARAELSAPPA